MTTSEIKAVDQQIADLEKQIDETKKKVTELRRARSGEEVQDYELTQKDGTKIKISELFGDKEDLLLVHNMGKGCAYCTLWADGFNGAYHHFEDRAAFALVSADAHETMKEFTECRGWGFTCLSGKDSTFTGDMGYLSDKGSPQPGVSAFRRDASGKIYRTAHTWFGPGDDFCPSWALFDLLSDGANGWSPKCTY
jgi:predicted dithiol-disulfide oxidoreductase (DUF899 family)